MNVKGLEIGKTYEIAIGDCCVEAVLKGKLINIVKERQDEIMTDPYFYLYQFDIGEFCNSSAIDFTEVKEP